MFYMWLRICWTCFLIFILYLYYILFHHIIIYVSELISEFICIIWIIYLVYLSNHYCILSWLEYSSFQVSNHIISVFIKMLSLYHFIFSLHFMKWFDFVFWVIMIIHILICMSCDLICDLTWYPRFFQYMQTLTYSIIWKLRDTVFFCSHTYSQTVVTHLSYLI